MYVSSKHFLNNYYIRRAVLGIGGKDIVKTWA